MVRKIFGDVAGFCKFMKMKRLKSDEDSITIYLWAASRMIEKYAGSAAFMGFGEVGYEDDVGRACYMIARLFYIDQLITDGVREGKYSVVTPPTEHDIRTPKQVHQILDVILGDYDHNAPVWNHEDFDSSLV